MLAQNFQKRSQLQPPILIRNSDAIKIFKTDLVMGKLIEYIPEILSNRKCNGKVKKEFQDVIDMFKSVYETHKYQIKLWRTQ